MSELGITNDYARVLRWKNRVWAAIIAVFVTVLLAVVVYSQALSAVDRWFYDLALHKVAVLRSDAKPVPVIDSTQKPDLKPVLIEINEASLSALGRWPWPRSTHAQLLNTLAQAPPRVVGFDIVFAQPEMAAVTTAATDADALFARAIDAAAFPVVLSVMYEQLDSKPSGRKKIVRPEAPLSKSAARLAHIHSSVDEDGSVRRVFLQEGFTGFVPLPYLGYALHTPRAAQRSDAGIVPLPALPNINTHPKIAAEPTDPWSQLRPTHLYPMARDDFDRISYVDILTGHAKPTQWKDRIVLISTTAAGLGDQYVSPVYSASTVMAGGEVVLALLHTLQLQDRGLPALQWANANYSLLLAIIIALGLVLSLRMLGLPMQVFVLSLNVGGVLLLCGLLFARTGIFVSPIASIFGALCVFSFWLLLRLRTVLTSEAAVLMQPPKLGLPGFLAPPTHGDDFTAPESSDPVDAHLLRLAVHSETQLAARNTLFAVLQVLPDAAFVLAPQELGDTHVWLANDAALRLISQHPPESNGELPSFTHLMLPFQALLTSDQLAVLAGSPFQWQLLLRRDLPMAFAAGIAARTAQGARFLVKSQVLQMSEQATLLPARGFVLSLLDLSVNQQLAAQRDASLQFLSHDLRSPPAAIIAMLNLEGDSHPAVKPLLSRIRSQAQRTLDLAEGFVQLSRAEQSEVYTFTPYDFNDLAVEAADELWAPAKMRGIRIINTLHHDTLLLNADRTMLRRAILNVLSNAVRHSPENGLIHLSTTTLNGCAQLHIEDAGAGIEARIVDTVFERFVQGGSPVGQSPNGAGLGLAFVRAVLGHHAGEVTVVSPCRTEPTPHGSRFTLSVPCFTPEVPDAA